MRFEMNERVKCTLNGDIFEGIVHGTEYYHRFQNGKVYEETRYNISFPNGIVMWVKEENINKINIVLENEDAFNYLLIDVCLKYRKFDLIPELLDKKE